MPKPKSPEPPKRNAEHKPNKATPVSRSVPQRKPAVKSAHAPRTPIPAAEYRYDDMGQLPADVEAGQLDDVPVNAPSKVDHKAPAHTGEYPALISELLSICVCEASDVRVAFSNRNRVKYKKIFDRYQGNLSPRDYSIVKGALFYLYEFSRVNSIDKDTALWMLGIYEIPASQIISYTSKEVLKIIAKEHGLSYSNKKAEDLVESIRGVINPSK